MTRPATPSWEIQELLPPPQHELVGVLQALVEAVSNMPQANLDVTQVVKAIKGVRFPESKPIDLTPIVEAIGKIELEVETPKAPEPVAPCAYTFKVLRDSSGILTGIIATPGLIEQPEHTDTASYE